MKKIITLCLLVFAMLLGTESAIAQTSKIEINAIASQETKNLQKFVKLNSSQIDQVYEAMLQYTKVRISLLESSVIEDDANKKNEKALETKMQSILTEEQFSHYKAFSESSE